MKRNRSKNLDMLAVVAKGLKGLKEKVVFVGGATIELYLTGPATGEARPTDDVDCVVELTGRVQYYDLEEELRKLGFKHPLAEKAPICRWEYCGIQVDVMPTHGKVLGFKNRWYADGVASAEQATLPDGQVIWIFTAPYLLASKVEAFSDRGEGDFFGSRDIEDILAILDGAFGIEAKILAAPPALGSYLKEKFREFLADPRFIEVVQGNVRSPEGNAQRADEVLALLNFPSKNRSRP